MTVKEIIIKYLDDNSYDGLCNDNCGCSKDDLVPCGSIQEDCNTAYRCECDKDCGEYLDCFTPTKQKKCWRKD